MKFAKKFAAASAAAMMLGLASQAHAIDGYLDDTKGVVVRNTFNECWRTGTWTPAMAIVGCDGKVADVVQPTKKPDGPQAAPKSTISAEALFDFNKAVIKDAGKAQLDSFIEQLKRHPEAELVVVEGHTDRIGRDAYNQKLSEKRAAAVKQYMVDHFIDADRIRAVGKGETEPTTATASCTEKKTKANIECLQPDRRVVLAVEISTPVKK